MAYEKSAFTASSAYDLALLLSVNAGNLATALASGATATSIDGVSQQTWYGVPEAIGDDLNQAIDLVSLVTKKAYSALV